jgi:hypothetical protein
MPRRSASTPLTRDQAAALLGVPHDAAPAAVRKAFRAQARALHPDRNPSPDAAEAFARARAAYELLLQAPTAPEGRRCPVSASRPPRPDSHDLSDLEHAECDADFDVFFNARGRGFSRP